MATKWLKKLRSKTCRRSLALAVVAGLMSGVYAPNLEASEFTDVFTGLADGNSYTSLVNEMTGHYNFQDESTITINGNGFAAIDFPTWENGKSSPNVKIVVGEDLEEGPAERYNLNLVVGPNGDNNVYGIREYGPSVGFNDTSLFLDAKNINIGVQGNKIAYGIYSVDDQNTSHMGQVNTLTAENTNIKVKGAQGAYGIYVKGKLNALINGNLNATAEAGWAIDGGSDSSNFKTVGLYAGDRSRIDVRDNANISVNGTGFYAEGNKASISIDKAANITTNKDSAAVNYALAVKGGKININQVGMEDGSSYTKANKIYGNIGFIGAGGGYDITLGNGSVLEGVIVRDGNTDGLMNLTLVGANSKWVNEAYGAANAAFTGSIVDNFVGANKAGAAAKIYQKDSHSLTINNYSGHSMVIYEHTGKGTSASDFAAGDTIVKAATQESQIVLSTGNNNVNMGDTLEVDKVLNALASKLVYSNIAMDKNLAGKVQIADGLTGSEAAKRVEDIVFDEEGRGGYGSTQTKVKFDQAITGEATDQAYVDAGVLVDGTYSFQKDSYVKVAGAPAVDVKKPLNIDAGKTTLTIESVQSQEAPLSKNIVAFNQALAGTSTIKAGTLKVVSTNNQGLTRGISVDGVNGQSTLNIDGNVEVLLSSHMMNNPVGIGLQTNGDAAIKIDGNLAVKRNPAAAAARYPQYLSSAVFVGGDKATHKGGNVTINGDLDVEGGLFVNGSGSTITVAGGGKIVADKGISTMAINAQSGTISVNMDAETHAAGTKNLVVDGNVVLTNGLDAHQEQVKESIVNIGLNTAESALNGLVIKALDDPDYTATTNMVLANGAQWNNAIYGQLPAKYKEKNSFVDNFVGGADNEKRGVIKQNSDTDLYLDQYSGHALVIYEHKNQGDTVFDYQAGDVIVNKAAEGSVITVSTDNNGIDLNNLNLVNNVLNTLAGKLTYAGITNDQNLLGQVQIADGLTGSSKALRIKDITFDPETGKGSYQKPDDSVVATHNVQLIEDNYQGNAQREYYQGKYISNGNRGYTFESNTVIDVTIDKDPYDESTHSLPRGVIAWSGGDGSLGDGDGYIDMTGHKLTLNGNAGPDFNKRPTGIFVSSDTLTIKNVKGLDININNSLRDNALMVQGFISHGAWNNGSGIAKLVVENGRTMDEAVKIRFNNCGDIQSAIKIYDNSGSAALDIKGMLDVYVGLEGAVGIENFDGEVYVGGGKIISVAGNSIKMGGYKSHADTMINMEKSYDGSYEAVDNNRLVDVEGNLYLAQNADLGIAFTSNDSKFIGGVTVLPPTDINVNDGETETVRLESGKAHLLFANGATWTNQSNLSSGWTGSRVAELMGGRTEEARGVILQKDANDLMVDKYSGNMIVIYDHAGQGTQAGDYKAGNIVIGSAEPKAGIVLSTDNTGFDTQNDGVVKQVLNALAGKLIYNAYTTGEKNLSGKVQIADGLTGSSAALAVGNIAFSEANGQGSYVPEVKAAYDQAITGTSADSATYGDAYKGEGLYEFATGSNITIDNGIKAGIDAKQGLTINAQGSTLNLVSVGDDFMNSATGIQVKKSGVIANINANSLNLTVEHKDSMSGAVGILVQSGTGTSSVANINSDVNMNVKGGNTAYGVRVKDNGQVTINGNLTVKAETIEAYNQYSPGNTGFGIMVDDTYQGENKVTVNGDTNLKIKGNGVFVKRGTAELNGSVNIEVEKQAEGKYNAVAVEGMAGSATVNINAANSAANDIIIKGNMTTYKNSGNGAATINLNMNNKNSMWIGVADPGASDKNGKINLGLANGATWVNEAYGNQRESVLDGPIGSTIENFTGSASAADMGAIVQRHAKELTINNYSGNAVVIYKHNNSGEAKEDYIGGDTIIKKAAAGSGIVLSTDATNIYTSDENQTNKVLNALAGKLVYAAYDAEKAGTVNLKGKVQIADGLTASSASKVVGDITFTDGGRGSYVAPEKPTIPDHQNKFEFVTTLTGKLVKDGEYLYGGVLQEDGTYVFAKDSTINITNGFNGIRVDDDVVVNAKGSNLNINVNGSGNVLAGVKQTSLNKAEINADNITINAHSSDSRAEGLSMDSADLSKVSRMEINSNLFINATGNTGEGYALGIYANGNSKLTVNGNIVMKNEAIDGQWGVINEKHFDFMQTVGIYAGPNYGIQKGAVVDVNGDVDLVIKGTGVMANGGGSKVNLNNGNVTIKTNKDAKTIDYALVSASGIVNVNMKGNKAGDNTVIIEGNIATDDASAHPDEKTKESVVNLGLSTRASVLHGLVVDAFSKTSIAQGFSGSTNLYVSNGATWINEKYGATSKTFAGSEVEKFVGGANREKSGLIEQKDRKNLTINNYSGHSVIIYDHLNDGTKTTDFKAGDTVIKHAEAGSNIIMYTNSNGITISDSDQVNTVLNNLADKLVYEAYKTGENNVAGYVKIAEGLTSVEVGKYAFGQITFDQATGHGTYEVPTVEPEHQTETYFDTAITGGEDKAYNDANVAKEQGKYVFEKNSEININALNGAAIDVQNDISIDAKGSSLNLVNDTRGLGKAYGIKGESNNKLEIEAQKLNIKVLGKEDVSTRGISLKKTQASITGDVDINVMLQSAYADSYYNQGILLEEGAKLTINGNVTMQGADGAWGIDGGNAYGIQTKAGEVNVNGNVNLAVNGTGIYAEQGTVNVQGGTIKINKDGKLDELGRGDCALNAENGIINVNMNADGSAANHKVNIWGNSSVTDNFLGHGTINLALTTADSTFNGVLYKNTKLPFSLRTMAATASGINLTLANGATWTNEVYGALPEGFTGSVVDNLTGGTTKAGVILQKDSNSLTIDNFSGKAMVIYEHTGDGSKAEDFAAGNTVINKAAAESNVVVSTDNTGINTEDITAVEKVLNNLAGKLVYTASATGEANLTGKVQIADGLTGSSASKQVGDISFTTEGQGQYVAGSITPGAGGGEGGEVEHGDYENNVMKGTRSAMMTSMLAWRDVAADFTNRTSELRGGIENGAWARIYGGKTEYDGANTAFDSSYGAVQFGYDQEVGRNWNAGFAVDYQDGEADYVMGGEGDQKLYSVGLYASRAMADKGYVDLSAKLGRVENDFTASNGLGLTADGEYVSEGYSISAQYGKRFGDAAKGYVEPQLQLTWARMSGDSFTATANNGEQLKVNQDAFESLVGRFAIQAGKVNAKGGMYARLGLAHEFLGDIDGSYDAKDGGLKSTSFDLGDTWSELSLGMNYNLNDNSNFYIDLTKGLSGDYKQEWKANLGYRFTF